MLTEPFHLERMAKWFQLLMMASMIYFGQHLIFIKTMRCTANYVKNLVTLPSMNPTRVSFVLFFNLQRIISFNIWPIDVTGKNVLVNLIRILIPKICKPKVNWHFTSTLSLTVFQFEACCKIFQNDIFHKHFKMRSSFPKILCF